MSRGTIVGPLIGEVLGARVRRDCGYTLEFFSNASCDASGFDEGTTFLGALTALSTNAGGNTSFSTKLPITVPARSFVTATATDSKGNTSECSLCRQST